VERLARDWGFEANDLLNGLTSEVDSLRAFGVYEEVPVETAVYYHIEVDGHQVISANGVLSETYYEAGKRRAFNTVFSN
jgi:hypothetical protein